MKEYPYIKLDAAAPYERGVQYGTQAKPYIECARDHYKAFFIKRNEDWKQVCEFALKYADEIEKQYPELLEEAAGIAAGAGVPLAEIMVINCRYEISKFSEIPECTTGAVLPEASGSGKTFSLKNWDFSRNIMGHLLVLHIITEDGTRILGLTEAGQMIRDGFNNYGLSIGTNNLQSVYDEPGVGIPVTFLRRRILMSREFEEAVEVIRKARRTISNNILLTDGRNGRTVNFEWHPKGAYELHPKDGILTHANHFVADEEIDALAGRPKNRDTRLRELLMKQYGHITVDVIKECLRDHEYYPLSICGHPTPGGEAYVRDRITVSSMIVDFDEQSAYICAGPPCEGEYKKYDL